MKRGQLTMFILAAVMIVFLIVVVFFFLDLFAGNSPEEETAVRSFVLSCLDSTTDEAIEFVSRNGGYYVPPEESLDGIAYYFFGGEDVSITRERMEGEIEAYIDKFFLDCVNDFYVFPEKEISGIFDGVNVKIEDEVVNVEIDYRVSVTNEGDVVFDDFNVDRFSDLFLVHRTSVYIVNGIVNDGGEICINCIHEYALENDLYVSIHDYSDSSWLFIVRDLSLNEEEPLIFYFMVEKNE